MRDTSPAAVHKRLIYPQNAVIDIEIDLKRRRVVPPPSPAPIPTVHMAPLQPYRAPRWYPAAQDITRVICEHYRVTVMDLRSGCKCRDIVRPRMAWCYIARTMTPWSTPKIGQFLGGRDHTTVLSAYRRMQNLIAADPAIAADIAAVRAALNGLFMSRSSVACFDPREI